MSSMMGDQFAEEQNMIKDTLDGVSTKHLRSFLEELTKKPHIAGHQRDNELINYIRQKWIDYGFDRVELAEYDFYLSWPNQVSFFLSVFLSFFFCLIVVIGHGFLVFDREHGV